MEIVVVCVTEKTSTTVADGKNYQTQFYNLDAIISVGYRVNSTKATKFRIWATGVLKEYIRKGFALDDNRLKNLGSGGYWKELLERIRDIRSSEKVFYRQVLDIYATSIGYNPKADIFHTCAFFMRNDAVARMSETDAPKSNSYWPVAVSQAECSSLKEASS